MVTTLRFSEENGKPRFVGVALEENGERLLEFRYGPDFDPLAHQSGLAPTRAEVDLWLQRRCEYRRVDERLSGADGRGR